MFIFSEGKENPVGSSDELVTKVQILHWGDGTIQGCRICFGDIEFIIHNGDLNLLKFLQSREGKTLPVLRPGGVHTAITNIVIRKDEYNKFIEANQPVES